MSRLLKKIKKFFNANDNSHYVTKEGVKINFNKDRNGIEIQFNNKLDCKKELFLHGFSWSRKFSFWYAKDNEDRREFLINQGLLIIKDYDILEAIRNAFK